jgi:beta-galactosidase
MNRGITYFLKCVIPRLACGVIFPFAGGGLRGEMASAASGPAPTYSLDASLPNLAVVTGGLKMGGKDPAGVAIGVNSRYLTMGGRPWFPVMGEFHFGRYPRAQWDEELLKMQAGGITIVSTYIFWIYHEETEGKFDWSGDRDLRAFVQLCAKHGLACYPRLGPWAHGEVRNGGLPDWLLAKCGPDVRQDKEPYLTYVRSYYTEIAAQLHGLLWKDGGPVVGLQLDNELRNNPQHLLTLKRLARAAGLDVPLYTMTGWDRAQIPPGGELLPLFGGYPDGFWIAGVSDWDRAGRKQYFFGLERDDSIVGDDLRRRPGAPETAGLAQYPYGACEIGGGIEVSYRRRPVLGADDVAAEALVKLGSGSNLQGYYMYHGGADQIGRLSPLNESRASGYPNDMPEINYDFQAPLGEYGQRRPSYDALRIQHLFLAGFGRGLAPLPALFPDQRPASLDDRQMLRWAVRSDGRRGFIFVNNYQHLDALPAHDRVQFQVRLSDGILPIPTVPVSVPAGRYFIWPFNQAIGGAVLTYATAQPLCRVGDVYVFFALPGINPEFAFDPRTLRLGARARVNDLTPGTDCFFPVDSRDRRQAHILVLTEEEARQAWEARIWGAERLFLSSAGLIFDGDNLRLQSLAPTMSFSVFPSPPLGLPETDDGPFAHFTVNAVPHPVAVDWRRLAAPGSAPPVRVDAKGAAFAPDDTAFAAAAGTWEVHLAQDALRGAHEVFLRIDYVGDIGRAYLGGRLVDDDFYFGRPWEIGLSRFAPEVLEKGLTVKILPLRRDAPIYLPKDRWPAFGASGQAGDIRGITAYPEYEVVVSGPPAAAN